METAAGSGAMVWPTESETWGAVAPSMADGADPHVDFLAEVEALVFAAQAEQAAMEQEFRTVVAGIASNADAEIHRVLVAAHAEAATVRAAIATLVRCADAG